MKQMTLVIVQHDNKVLLGMKKRGFGAGRWNGFGGKVQPDESIEDAARHETSEEAGIHVADLEERGIITFTFEENDDVLEVHIFRSTQFMGQPLETEEMKPQWFAVDAIPFDQMWKDDPLWFPLFLDNKLFRGAFHFNADHQIIKQELSTVSAL